MKKQPIYIIGHKNPDTDSICSAIAYADIKRRTESGDHIAARAGQLNEETEYVLRRFGIEPPFYLPDVGTQVRDMEIRQTPGVPGDISIKDAWSIMKTYEAVTLPITTGDGQLAGLITKGDIANTYMNVYDSFFLSQASPKYQSIADTVGGIIIAGDGERSFSEGKVLVGAAHPDKMEAFFDKGDLTILGDRTEDHMRAVTLGAACIIFAVGAQPSEEIKQKARQSGCVLISTPEDTFTAARLINQSIPVRHVMKSNDLVTFKTDEFTNDIRDTMVKTRARAFPVTDKNGVYVGTISRRNLLGMKKKQLILIDHNEKSQAVDNSDEAEILEIVDHHRLGAMETIEPVFFRNQPVGCTATIMYQIYHERRLTIEPNIAGILCAAIISDTLMFRSPTCTGADKEAAESLAEVAGIEIEGFAAEMFHAGSSIYGKSPEEIFYQDFKKFIAGNRAFGVGQFSSMDSEELQSIRPQLDKFMKNECGKNGMSMIFFMLTHIASQSTDLICYGEGSKQLVEGAFDARPDQMGIYYLEGILSRKKQLIPAFMNAIQENI